MPILKKSSVTKELKMSHQFQSGDVVILNSDPRIKMTVNFIYDDSLSINCVWFWEGDLKQADFYATTLKLISSE
jgi:uncharacterized protein YodC (DUF2158 family)